MNVKIIKNSIIYMLGVALLSSGCNKINFNDEINGPIQFGCDSVATTRGAGFTQSGNNAILSMGVYAAITPSDWSSNAPFEFMQNQKVERADAASPWAYNPEVFWPSGVKMSFFAYAPYNAMKLSNGSTTGTPEMQFSVNRNHVNQVDLLVSASIKDQTKTSANGKVNFRMSHALSRVSFAAKLVSPTASDVVVTSIELKNLYEAGTCPMEAVGREWSLKGLNIASYTLTDLNGGGLEASKVLNTTEYQNLNTDNGYLFLMPQNVPANAKIVIRYKIGDSVESPLEFDLSKVISKWQPGEALRFLINLELNRPFNVEMSYQFESWTDVSSNVSIDANPFLYVSESTTTTYDAAVTRVYFYTNQSQESVRIDPKGRLSSIDGEEVDISSKFYALEEMDGAMNNFYYNANEKKGHFDLIYKLTYPVAPGYQTPVLVRLRAGKVDNYVKVTPYVTPYVAETTTDRLSLNGGQKTYGSAFHRRSERGERIITWHVPSTMTWKVTVESAVDGAYLDIDREPSPDHKAMLLYTSSARDPEGSVVGKTKVLEGRGRIYFRLGWSNTSPNGNRYARIKIVVTEKTGTTSKDTSYYIFCRQGEEPEAYTSTSGNVPAFSPYNLVADGELAKFPSQGGFISQWGRPKMWPSFGKDKPAGYPTDPVTEPFDKQVNICPDGYRYPTASELLNVSSSSFQREGYCADGYLDRRHIRNHMVEFGGTNVAAIGLTVGSTDMTDPNPKNLRTQFFPAAMYRDVNGLLRGDASGFPDAIEDGRNQAGYWSGEEGGASEEAYAWMFSGESLNRFDMFEKQHSFFMRCVKMDDHVMLTYDGNGARQTLRPTSAEKNTKVYIPRKTPKNYWRPGYFFNNWNLNRDGHGADKYLPGQTMSANITKNMTIYAQWSDFLQVDFTSIMTAEEYAVYGKTNSYKNLSILNNGVKFPNVKYSTADDIKTVTATEPVYAYLRFHNKIKNAATWNIAYADCKAMTDENRSWRLPRLSELMLFSQNTPIPEWSLTELFGAEGSPLWVGTESSTVGNAYQVTYYNSNSISTPKTSIAKYRCVSEYK